MPRKDPEYLKKYFKDNPIKNKLACHNVHRRKHNLKNINEREFAEYRKHFGMDKLNRIKTVGKFSNVLVWEEYKKVNGLTF